MLSTPAGGAPGASTTWLIPVVSVFPWGGPAGAGALSVEPDALRIMAATTLSPAPAFLRAMIALADVSYFPGDELMVVTISSSESFALMSLTTASLFSISCEQRTGHTERSRQTRNLRITTHLDNEQT